MKLTLILLLVIIAMSQITNTGAADTGAAGQYRTVFEFASEGTNQVHSVLNNLENVLKALGEGAELFVIAHGPGLGLVLKGSHAEEARVQDLLRQKVVFAACENTMRKMNVSSNNLLPGVTTVDSGVAEVIRRQAAGWSYVKSGT